MKTNRFKKTLKYISNIKKKLNYEIDLNNVYLNILSSLILFLGKKKTKLLIKSNSNLNDLEDLTPYINEKETNNYNIKTYLQSLKWGILNQNVKNIAISGSFGTGKSTVLNLFKKENPEFKILDINLGKFEERSKQTEVDIETSIVQQILYFEKKSNLKDSRFERITSDNFVLLKVFLLILWIYSILYIFFEKVYNKLIIFNDIEYDYYSLSMKILFLLGVFFILKKLVKQIFKLKINKVSFNDAEFIPKENDISIINKHVDELIYFFEKTKTQIVFIEDIDRFEDAVEVFIKLRELNIIINNSKDIAQKVTFVYAVKDELFSTNNEKTKFFDLIVPIIPIIDYSNSNTQFIKRLKSNFIDNEIISKDIIYDVSPFINDMRSLINIINEFKIYYKIKSNENKDISGDNLFSLIILKNLYPVDFKCLQNKEGFIYKVFENKYKLYSDLKSTLKDRIDFLEKENDKILKEQQENIEELRKLYLYEILVQSKNAATYYLDQDPIKIEDILTTNQFEKMVELNNIFYYDYRSGKIPIKFTEIENKISTETSYKDRQKIIDDKLNNKISNNKTEILKIKNEITDLKNSNLYQLLKRSERHIIESYYTNIIFEIYSDSKTLEEHEKNDRIEKIENNYNLLKVLINNKYVDENYSTYISLFYPESITEKDNNLKLRIIQDGKTEFNESIDEIKYLISELGNNNFKKEAIFNYNILHYLLQNYRNDHNINEKLEEFINTLIIKDNRSIDFIGKFIDFSEFYGSINEFIIKISSREDFWNLVYLSDEIIIEKKKKILDQIIKYVNIKEIKALNKDKNINVFINNYDDFLLNITALPLTKELLQEIINKLNKLEIKFIKIKYENSLSNLISEIIKNKLYEINANNINLFLEKINKNKIKNLDFKKSNYSYLLKSDINYLIEHIENNINEYVESVLLKNDNNTEEEYEVVKKLINNGNIKEENINSLIEKLNFKIFSITEINNHTFLGTLFMRNKIFPDWSNVLLYYQNYSKQIDIALVEFLNESINYQKLSEKCIVDVDDSIDRLTINNFSISIVNCEISTEAFGILATSINSIFDDITVIKKRNRISKLIQLNLLAFNNTNLVNLDEIDLKTFIEKNEESLEKQYESLELPILKWSIVLKSNISDILKKEIFNFLSSEMKYDENDEIFLMEIIKILFKENIFVFSEAPDNSHYFMSCAIASKIELNIKIKLLNVTGSYLNKKQIIDYLKILGEPYSLLIRKEKVEFQYSFENQEFLKLLQKHSFIKRTYQKVKSSMITVSYND
ncbi:hypothetical protein [Elizabethkingia anophelis]|uniref:YobI family P-loop NTPase n=1 Tax=Elizabethkingia anophelis TaxID=1117645 RepID=UPI00372F07D7